MYHRCDLLQALFLGEKLYRIFDSPRTHFHQNSENWRLPNAAQSDILNIVSMVMILVMYWAVLRN
jgi:hypothetical protein